MRLVACGVLLAGLGVCAAEPERFDAVVRKDVFAGFGGDKARMAKGLKACEDKLAADPKHAEALVWRGAIRVFQSGPLFQAGKVQDGLKEWNGGLADMDKAVELQPDSVGVRIPRAAVLTQASHAAPPAMAKPLLEKLKGDMLHSIKLHGKEWADIGDHNKGEVRMALAYAYRRLGDGDKSVEQLKLVKEELPGSKWADRADEWLKAKPEAKLVHQCIGCHGG